ncbi:MAG TPA: RNA 2',3'-cyclic phosphodiesterase [Candidatus Omnitrophica bacterium]|nr:RNA 2',3'-cyclic phosphodiesterase [Candidatus Omnitrophota bacterium]
MRTFIAIKVPENIQKNFRLIQKKLKRPGQNIKWVNPENIHLTLKFLGETKETQLPQIKKVLVDAASEFKISNIKIGTLGVFPGIKNPRIIWIGAEEKDTTIAEIAEILNNRLKNLGFIKEKRKFTPHITIARIRSLNNITDLLNNITANIDFEAGEFKVNKICLIQSRITSSGSIYNMMAEARLTPA